MVDYSTRKKILNWMNEFKTSHAKEAYINYDTPEGEAYLILCDIVNNKGFEKKENEMRVYYGIWEYNELDGLMNDFEISNVDLKYLEILFAVYEYEDCSGKAFVLVKEGNKLFEINASHCSCSGLENQWELEETDIATLRHRIKNGDCFTGFDNELTYALDELEKDN